jgi:hypothetical protein
MQTGATSPSLKPLMDCMCLGLAAGLAVGTVLCMGGG